MNLRTLLTLPLIGLIASTAWAQEGTPAPADTPPSPEEAPVEAPVEDKGSETETPVTEESVEGTEDSASEIVKDSATEPTAQDPAPPSALQSLTDEGEEEEEQISEIDDDDTDDCESVRTPKHEKSLTDFQSPQSSASADGVPTSPQPCCDNCGKRGTMVGPAVMLMLEQKVSDAVDKAVGGGETAMTKLRRVQKIVSDIEENKLNDCDGCGVALCRSCLTWHKPCIYSEKSTMCPGRSAPLKSPATWR